MAVLRSQSHSGGVVSPIDLKVPFHDKDAAKRLGARWNAERRTWFVPDGVPMVAATTEY